MNNSLSINCMELDPNKIYHIAVEVGDMNVKDAEDHLTKVKDLFSSYGIKAIYSAMTYGIHNVTITDLNMLIKEPND